LLLYLSGLYELLPESGTLAGGASQQVVLRFRPQEVEDLTRVIICDMPAAEKMFAGAGAAGGAGGNVAGGRVDGAAAPPAWAPLVREVSGKVTTEAQCTQAIVQSGLCVCCAWQYSHHAHEPAW